MLKCIMFKGKVKHSLSYSTGAVSRSGERFCAGSMIASDTNIAANRSAHLPSQHIMNAYKNYVTRAARGGGVANGYAAPHGRMERSKSGTISVT